MGTSFCWNYLGQNPDSMKDVFFSRQGGSDLSFARGWEQLGKYKVLDHIAVDEGLYTVCRPYDHMMYIK